MYNTHPHVRAMRAAHKKKLKRLAIPARYTSWKICVNDWPRVTRYKEWWVERDPERNTKWKRHIKKAANRKVRHDNKKLCRDCA